MNSGTKPTSANVLAFTGGRSRSGASLETEPQPTGDVIRPAFVKGGAQKLWEAKAPDLIAHGVLTCWDVEAFGVWCVLMAEFQKAPKKFTSAKLTQMRLAAEQFGLAGQSSRARLKTGGNQSKDPAEKFFAS